MVEENKNNKSKYIIDKVTRAIFLVCALIAVISLILIIGFVFYKGLRPFSQKENHLLNLYLEPNGIQHLKIKNMEYYR